MSKTQSPDTVVMIRPHAFRSNSQTQNDNSFQQENSKSSRQIATDARREFDTAVSALRAAGIKVHVFDDDGTQNTPDSVFPNNWFSTHTGGHIAIYPMHAENRQNERRWDVIDQLKRDYRVQDVIDYSGLEQDSLALEGTGAMVLDHIGRVAYTVQSNRADPVLLERFCTHFNYEPIAFIAKDAKGHDVYHTNVLMAVGTDYALICLDMITDPKRRKTVASRLAENGRDVIALSHDQILNFAGNAMELTSDQGRILALSERALAALEPDQIKRITQSASLLPLSIPTIETAGGSVRCMLAGIHLTHR